MRYKHSKFSTLAILQAVGALACGSVSADELADFGEFHGFLSQGFIKTTDNNYLANSELGSFDFTEAGLNFTKQLTDTMRTGAQLFTRHQGPAGNFEVKLDWFYFDYHPLNQFGLRFGRVKLPFGLYNDSSDVDSARVPVLLPQSVYPTQNRDYLLAQTGVELYGYAMLGSAGALDYRLYGGTIFLDLTSAPGSPVQVKSLDVPYVVGGRLLWDTPLQGLRVGMTGQALRLDTTLLFGSTFTPASGQIPALLWVGSLEYAKGDLLLASEYSRWYVRTGNSTNPTLFPTTSSTSERAYVMGSYRLNNWLQPALYYSVFFTNVDMRDGRENQQHDISATLRFDINRFWLVKLEGHYMIGTAGLNSSLNDGIPLSALADKWGAFLIKTTAYF